MSRRKTRFLAVLLSLALAFSLSGVIVLAVDDDSNDMPETPVAALAVEPEIEETVIEGEGDSINVGTPETQNYGEGEPVINDDENTQIALADGDEAFVTTNAGVRTYYETLQAAITAADNGDTVTLVKDITADCSESNFVTISKSDITVDLGENTITVIGTNAGKYLFYIGSGSSFILKNGTINGQYIAESGETVNSTVTAIDSHAESIVVDEITIQNFGAATNGVIFVEDGDFTITNCNILNNQTYGIYAFKCYDTKITGCTISENTGGTNGGGICFMNEHGNLCIEHNTISNNNSGCNGGGICIYLSKDASASGEFAVTGNTITKNTAQNDGGGIYFETRSVTADEEVGDFDLSGNIITYNTANTSVGYGGGIGLRVDVEGREVVIKSGIIAGNCAYWGGGIDSSWSDCQSLLHLYNAIITDNVAGFRGGGIWACPTSETTMNVTFGAAIYGNTATGEESLSSRGASGDSIRFEGADSDASSAVGGFSQVSERALGGALMDWYADEWDGNRYQKGDQTVDVTSNRYIGFVNSFGLHGELSPEGIALAKEDALLYIVNNTSQTNGGGIATNTAIGFGSDEAYTSLTVTANKVWYDENGDPMTAEQTADYSVDIILVRQDKDRGEEKELEAATLNAENSWTWDFEDLPTAYMTCDKDETTGEYTYTEHSYTYTVKEVSAETNGNIEVEVKSDGATKNTETGKLEQTVIISNTFVVKPTLSKEIAEDDYERKDQDIEHDDKNGHFEENIEGDGWGTWDDADNNQEITFHLTLTDIQDAVNITVHDYLEEGLDFEHEVEVVLFDGDTQRTLTSDDYTMSESACSDPSGCAMAGCTFEIQFKDSVFQNLGDNAYIVITYKALTETHEEDYEDYVDEILNHSYMTYGINSYRSSIVTTATDLFGFGIYKYAVMNGTETALAGAKFILERDGAYATFTIIETDEKTGEDYYMVSEWVNNMDSAGTLTSDKDGMIRIEGLDDDTYTLTETAAPSGYQRLTSSIQVTISENGEITLENQISGVSSETAHEISVRNVAEETTSTSETVQIVGTKTWVDDDDDFRPESINILLYADGELIKSRTVRASDSWRFSFTGLDKYGSDGHEIVYTIEEVQVPGYSTEYDGYNITNTYITEENELIEISVIKMWDDSDNEDGIRPDSVTVELYLNGEPTDMTLILDESNGWSGTFADLQEETDGVKNVWTVSEIAVEGYESSVSGDTESGFAITNTHTPDEIEVPEEPVDPDVPEEPDIPQEPETPEEPQEPSGPETPETSDESEDVSTPETPENPDEQVTPGTPAEPENSDSGSDLPQTGARWNLVVCIVMLAFGGTMLVVAGRGMMCTERRKRR